MKNDKSEKPIVTEKSYIKTFWELPALVVGFTLLTLLPLDGEKVKATACACSAEERANVQTNSKTKNKTYVRFSVSK